MYVKGFLNINTLLSNVPGVVAPIGELSPYSYTFSREKGFYQANGNTKYDLITFLCTNSSGAPIQLPNGDRDIIIAVSDFVFNYIAARTPPYDLDNMRYTLYSLYPTVRDLAVGELVSTMPEWISWTHNNGDEFMIWFHDEAFRNQYDEYTIIPVGPVPNIDVFFQSDNNILTALSNETMDKLMIRVGTAKGEHPETILKVLRFDYYSPTDPNIVYTTDWPVLIYGAAGDHIDAIKDALVDYILTHSVHDESEWMVRFPAIFKRTEMVVNPMWERIAIPNTLTTVGIYSQVFNPLDLIQHALMKTPFYSNIHIQNHTRAVPLPYKSLQLAITNGPNNVPGLQDFAAVYNDYIPVPSTSLDFNRMRLKTQELARELTDMIIYAETMTRYSFLPTGTKRVKRNGQIYLAKLINNINFLVLPRNVV